MQCDNTAAAAAAAAAGVELNLRSDVFIHCLHILLFFSSTPFLPFPLAVFASSSSYSASASPYSVGHSLTKCNQKVLLWLVFIKICNGSHWCSALNGNLQWNGYFQPKNRKSYSIRTEKDHRLQTVPKLVSEKKKKTLCRYSNSYVKRVFSILVLFQFVTILYLSRKLSFHRKDEKKPNTMKRWNIIRSCNNSDIESRRHLHVFAEHPKYSQICIAFVLEINLMVENVKWNFQTKNSE